MVKQFFSENINGMSFTFAFLVLLNALMIELTSVEMDIRFVWILALLVLVSHSVYYAISYFDFNTAFSFHFANLGAQLVVFFGLTSLLNLVPFTIETILTNGTIYIILYAINVRKNRMEMQKVAHAINQQLLKK